MATIQYIIREPFDGSLKNVVHSEGTVQYTTLSLEQYLTSNPSLRVVSEKEFNDLSEKFWTTPFQEITEDQWWEYYCQLPPKSPQKLNERYFFDYSSEPTWGQYHSIYFRDHITDKFYTCTLSICTPNDQIVEKFRKDLKQSTLNKE